MRLISVVVFSLIGMAALGQAQQTAIPLWPGVAPGSESWTQAEATEHEPRLGGEVVRNVVAPTLTVFPPEPSLANGTAVIVCPGGAFQFLSWTNEGTEVAKWLNKLGITVFLLKYRTTDTGVTKHDFEQKMMAMFMSLTTDFKGMNAKLAPAAAIAAQDGRKAVELVRQNAAKWGVAPDRIGIIGFSAGASVALDTTLEYAVAGRPSFTASIYGPGLGSKTVPTDAPALFLLCASDDPLVPPTSSAEVYTGWKTSGHIAELHIFTKGGHGFGMTKHGLPIDNWPDLFQEWLSGQGLLPPK